VVAEHCPPAIAVAPGWVDGKDFVVPQDGTEGRLPFAPVRPHTGVRVVVPLDLGTEDARSDPFCLKIQDPLARVRRLRSGAR
jgi:hypothetical protein